MNIIFDFIIKHRELIAWILTFGTITVTAVINIYKRYGIIGIIPFVILCVIVMGSAWFSGIDSMKRVYCNYLYECETRVHARAKGEFDKINKAWNFLIKNYSNDALDDRLNLEKALKKFDEWLASELSDREQEELRFAKSYIEAWAQGNEEAWEIVVQEHPNDELTSLAQHEREHLSKKRMEATLWDTANKADTITEYRRYVDAFPDGAHVADANKRLGELIAADKAATDKAAADKAATDKAAADKAATDKAAADKAAADKAAAEKAAADKAAAEKAAADKAAAEKAAADKVKRRNASVDKKREVESDNAQGTSGRNEASLKKSGDELCDHITELSNKFNEKETNIAEIKDYMFANFQRPMKVTVSENAAEFFYIGKPIDGMNTIIVISFETKNPEIVNVGCHKNSSR